MHVPESVFQCPTGRYERAASGNSYSLPRSVAGLHLRCFSNPPVSRLRDTVLRMCDGGW